MKSTYTAAILCWILLSLSACQRGKYSDIPVDSKIVIEGWIEQGDVARVILSHSAPLTEEVDSSNYLKYVIRSAMVIVSDGTEKDTLRLKSDLQHLPPYVYTGEKIIGETGGQYHLTVKYQNKEFTAQTTIPASVPIESVEYIKEHPNDTTGHLTIRFTDPIGETNYYQVATLLENHDNIFIPALYGNLSDDSFSSSQVVFKITRGITVYPETNFQAYFTDGDQIRVKLRTMTEEGFNFWNSWQNEIMNALNPLFPANSSLKGNIKGGGIGFWGGYGQDCIYIPSQAHHLSFP
ncbi:DUF4249 domain-containing protein [Bacteroides sp. 224]|uniref:DUF4249 domain-containing protein n=1 Tax=Bacteroides sp. 224 TaxID=2302936 RepID=UPI0013D2EB9F|nr:DUF4249 domain-containing protein [Bacteroides sp. 224]NDV65685.1 DUF4249 domain-containing protein [Bacteroides sp. 224]